MNNRRMLPGCQSPTAAAPGDDTAEPIGFLAAPAGSPLLTDAAGTAVGDALPNSRRA
jgi:hypothetical protein